MSLDEPLVLALTLAISVTELQFAADRVEPAVEPMLPEDEPMPLDEPDAELPEDEPVEPVLPLDAPG